jgi:hypothetical protein
LRRKTGAKIDSEEQILAHGVRTTLPSILHLQELVDVRLSGRGLVGLGAARHGDCVEVVIVGRRRALASKINHRTFASTTDPPRGVAHAAFSAAAKP